MDVHEEAKPSTAVRKKKRGKQIAGWIISIIMLVALGYFIGVNLADSASKKVKIPVEITQQFAHPIYLPSQLPGNYEIIEKSFSIQEDVLVFHAKDGAGGTIIFTAQPKPKDFKFEAFYSEQLTDAKTLNNVPFPSVAGKSTTNNSNVLSIVTNETWIIASTKSPISPDDMRVIAKDMERYRQ